MLQGDATADAGLVVQSAGVPASTASIAACRSQRFTGVVLLERLSPNYTRLGMEVGPVALNVTAG